MRLATALLALTILGCPMPDGMRVHAGCPKVFVKKQAVALVQYVPVYPQQYQVGQAVRDEAIIEAAIARGVAKAVASLQATVTQTTTTTHVASVQGFSAGQFSRCQGCHVGESAKGGFRVDVELSCEDRLRAIQMMLHDDPALRMPRGAELPADELGKLIQSFSAGLPERASAVPPPEPLPPAPGTR